MKNGFVVIIAGVLRRWHVCRCHQVGTQQTVRRMFLLDTQSLDERVPGPNAGSSCASDMVSLPPVEAYTVQELMDLALPRFAGLGDGPRQVHAPWAMSIDSPASPATSRLYTSGEEDRAELASPCLDLDGLSSSDDDIGTLGGLSDLSVTLLCGSDEVFSPVNSDQVLSDVDFPPEPVSHDKRQFVRRRDASPDVLLVDAPPVRRPGDPRWSVARVPPGKRMPGEVSMTISPVPPSLDMTVMCASRVVPMSTQPPAVTSVPAMSMATVTSREVDVRPGPSRVRPVPRLGLASTSVGERVPAVVLSFTPRSVPTLPVPMGDGVPAVPSSVPPDCPTPSSSLTSSGQSATPSSQTLVWGMRVTRRYSCPPIVCKRDTVRMFRRSSVSSMYRRFRRDF